MADSNVVTLHIKLENGQWVSAAQETAKATDAIGKGAEEAGKKASNGLGKLGPLLAQIAKDLSGLRAASEAGFGNMAAQMAKTATTSAGMTSALRDSARAQQDMARTAQQAAQALDQRGTATRDAVEGSRQLGVVDGVAIEVGRQLLNVTSRLVAEFPRLVAQQISYAASIGDVAQRTGVSTEALSALGSQARMVGRTFGDITGALDTLGQNAQRAAGGSRQQAAAFAAMGVSVRDTSGHLKTTEALLGEVTSKLSGYRDGAARTALATQVFGSSAAELLPVLDQVGNNGLQGVIDKAREMGQVIDGDMAKAAQQLQGQMRTLREQVTGYATQVASDVLPSLTALVGAFVSSDTAATATAGSFREAGGALTGLGQSVRDAIAFFVSLYGAAQQVGVFVADVFTRIGIQWDELKAKLADPTWLQGLGTLLAGYTNANFALIQQGRAVMSAAGAQVEKEFADRRAIADRALGESLAEIEQRTRGTMDRLANSARDAATGINDALGSTVKPDAPLPTFGRESARVASQARDAAAVLVSSLQEQAATFGLAGTALDHYRVSVTAMTPAQRQAALDAIDLKDALEEIARAQAEEGAALERLQGIAASYGEQVEDTRAKMAGAGDAQIRFNKAMRDAQAAFATAGGASNAAAMQAHRMVARRAGGPRSILRCSPGVVVMRNGAIFIRY